MLTLHGYYRSSTSYRVRIALNLKGLEWRHAGVDLLAGEDRSADYLAVNPQGLLPTLELADGRYLSQSMAILEYLDEAHPEPSLLPAEPLARARVRSLALQIACDIHPLNNLRALKYLRSEFGQGDAAVNAWYRHWVAIEFEALERRLVADPATGSCCHGDAVSQADVCLVPQVYNAERFAVDMAAYPTLARIAAHCRALPAFTAAAPERQPDAR